MSSHLDTWQRRTAPILAVLAAAAVVILVLEAAFDVHTIAGTVLNYLVWAAFLFDYVWRIRLVGHKHRWQWVLEHPFDFLAVLLPVARVLRLVVSIARVEELYRRELHERVIATAVSLATTVVIAGAAVGLDAERHAPDANITSFGDAVWWALTTVTTVGYGDHYPVTTEGRLVGGILMVVGIASMTSVTAALALWLINRSDSAESANQRVGQLEDQIASLSAQRIGQLEDQIAHLRAQLDSARATPPPG